MFRAALEHSAAGGRALRWAPPPPRLPHIAARLRARYGECDAKRKSPVERAALLQRLRQVKFDWERVERPDRLAVAWVLWEGPDPPAEHGEFLRAFLRWLETPWRRVQASRVAGAWAVAFDPDSNSIRAVGAWLAIRASRLLQPWARLADRLDLFSPERGPIALAEVFLAADAPKAAGLADLGLPESVARGGLMLEALGAAADLVRHLAATSPRLAARLIEMSMHERDFHPDARPGITAARRLSIRVRLADALLLAWHGGVPPIEVKQLIVDHLLRHYRDPRAADEKWRGIDPSATAVMCDWLKETTLAAFFRIVGQHHGADPQEAQARQDFWISCVDHIDDAWLIAGRRAAAAADGKGLGCGRLVGCRADDCALLLKVNGSTVIETSRLGDQRIWRAGNPFAPVLDRHPGHSYSPGSLAAGADFSFGYSRGDGGPWQQQFGNFIEQHTGVAAAWRPKSATPSPTPLRYRASRDR